MKVHGIILSLHWTVVLVEELMEEIQTDLDFM